MKYFLLALIVCFPLQAISEEDQLGDKVLEECALLVPPPDVNNPDESPDYSLGGAYAPGKGINIARNNCGTMNVSGYSLVRYLNQMPSHQSFTDHNGVKHIIDPRNDIQLHRIMMWFNGFIFSKRLTYVFNFWSVYSTNQVAIVGSLNYKFNRYFNIGGGVNGLPGVRSLNGQHPYFLGTDRHMGEDFFKPGFTNGIWANGYIAEKLKYRAMVGNNVSQIGVSAGQLTRDMAYGATIWWLPTTGEFGPREGFGDYEQHEKLAMRFGLSFTSSREDRFNQPEITTPDNTQLRLSDSTLLFETGSLGSGVTINKANYSLIAADAAIKYKGLFIFAEYYHRRLDDFASEGNPNKNSIVDRGLEIQASYYIKPQKYEVYTAATKIWGEFNNPQELSFGFNYYPYKSRNFRINTMLLFVDESPVSSVFGYYVGGQSGTTFVAATDIFF